MVEAPCWKLLNENKPKTLGLFRKVAYFLVYFWFIFGLFSKKTKFHLKVSGFQGFYIRWLLISRCVHMEESRYLDLLKAFGYIERVVKSDFFFGKDLFYFIRAQYVLSYHLI